MSSGSSGRVFSTLLEGLRALPRIGLHLVLPAMVIGAFGGSLIDLLSGQGYRMTILGVVVGPVVFAFAINLLERFDTEHSDKMVALAEAYRRDENNKRRTAAEHRGELVKFEEHRARRR